jgi:hypothetical protein
MLRRRWASTPHRIVNLVNLARTAGFRADIGAFHRIRRLLCTDPNFRAFHEGRRPALAEFYQHEYDQLLGSYATLLSPADRTPDLRPHPATSATNG